MSITRYIKDIGRGKEGARSLNREQAQDLMGQVLAGEVSDLELGGFAIAMRIKGETPDELAGFLAAAQKYTLSPRPPAGLPRAIWLPSYNGARKLPNLTALLAALLAQAGRAVLVHGPRLDAGRVTTAEIFQALGWPIASTAAEVEAAWSAQLPVFMPIENLCPPLARLLAVRSVLGLRNSGHSLAKLLLPVEVNHAFRVVNFTHPEYRESLGDFLRQTGADALLMRGTEGEPVADARRTPRMDVFIAGQPMEALSVLAQEGVLGHVPDLPRQCDATTTAHFIRAVLDGRLALPEPLQRQRDALIAATAPIDATAAA